MGRAAENSKLRTRDPEAFREALKETANDAGATHAYIPGEAAQAYMQSDSYDQYTDPLRNYIDQINEAAVTITVLR